jgi:hypothetical protein
MDNTLPPGSPPVSVERDFAHLTAVARRPRRKTSEDPITDALFPSAPTPTSQTASQDTNAPLEAGVQSVVKAVSSRLAHSAMDAS